MKLRSTSYIQLVTWLTLTLCSWRGFSSSSSFFCNTFSIFPHFSPTLIHLVGVAVQSQLRTISVCIFLFIQRCAACGIKLDSVYKAVAGGRDKYLMCCSVWMEREIESSFTCCVTIFLPSMCCFYQFVLRLTHKLCGYIHKHTYNNQ